MQRLASPFTSVEAPVFSESGQQFEVSEQVSFALAAVAFGQCYSLTQSPHAADRLNLGGVGYFQHPRIEKLLMPARAKLLKVSPDNSSWDFALSKQLQMHIYIRSHCELPVIHKLAEPGSVYPAGSLFARLSHAALRQQPMICVQIRAQRPIKPFAVKVHAGNKSAAEDIALTLHEIFKISKTVSQD